MAYSLVNLKIFNNEKVQYGNTHIFVEHMSEKVKKILYQSRPYTKKEQVMIDTELYGKKAIPVEKLQRPYKIDHAFVIKVYKECNCNKKNCKST